MPEVSDRDYKRLQRMKEDKENDGKAVFKWDAGSGKVLGFSGIPGVTRAYANFGKLKKKEGGKPRQFNEPEPDKQTDGPAPDKPIKPAKGKNATIADIEAAVRKGYTTPEEAAGPGGGKEKWYESEGIDASGKQIYGKPTKVEPMSKNYAEKLGKAQATSQATGKPMGKQFTGPSSMKLEMGPKAGFHPYAAPVNLDEFNK